MNRRTRGFLIALILVALVIAGGVWRPWQDTILSVNIELTTDEDGGIGRYQEEIIFSGFGKARPVIEEEIDLTKWAGKLVRMEIEGELIKRLGGEGAGFAGCMAQIQEAAGLTPLEFVGWENNGTHFVHPMSIGSPALQASGEGESPFVYSRQGRLWHVFKVPQDATLKVTVKPLFAEEAKNNSKPFVPTAKTRRLPPKATTIENNGRPSDVFIYLIDALRADHLGCYGYSRPTSPAIDDFARQATLFENAYSTVTWTRPSTASLITGQYPSVHGIMHEAVPKGFKYKLEDWMLLLPEALKQADYKTYSLLSNAQPSEFFGFGQGVDEVHYERLASAHRLNAIAAGYLAKVSLREPVYMYLHTMEAHTPYNPKPTTFRQFDRGFNGSIKGTVEEIKQVGKIKPKITQDDVEYLIDLYDATIRDNDTGFAEFLALLRRTGRYDNALVILVADHGESFNEHGTIDHGYSLNQAEIHVPLIIKFPGGRFAGQRVASRISLIDIFPTVLGQVGLNPKLEYKLPGIDLAEVISSGDTESSRRIFAEVSKAPGNQLDLVTVIDEDGYKRIINLSAKPGWQVAPESIGLWDLKTDPKETKDLSTSLPVRAAYNEQLIAGWLVGQRDWLGSLSTEVTPAPGMTKELITELRALGYLQ